MDTPKKASHVRLYKKDNNYYASIRDTEGNHIVLDLGPNVENLQKVVKLLKEEFGGIQIPDGGLN